MSSHEWQLESCFKSKRQKNSTNSNPTICSVFTGLHAWWGFTLASHNQDRGWSLAELSSLMQCNSVNVVVCCVVECRHVLCVLCSTVILNCVGPQLCYTMECSCYVLRCSNVLATCHWRKTQWNMNIRTVTKWSNPLMTTYWCNSVNIKYWVSYRH